jgi:hypothetical protein
MNPCIYCGVPSSHYTVYVCDSQRKTMRCAPKVMTEIVMSGAVVRKARELHEMRRHTLQSSVGFHDLGEIR